MVRPTTKAKRQAETQGKVLDRVVLGIEPDVLMAGMLGAAAAMGGITPPLTLLLSAFNDQVNSSTSTWHLISTPGWQLITEWIGGQPSSTSGMDPTDRAKMLGQAASGALEAMLMMTLMKNPAALKAFSDGLASAASLVKPSLL
jgi:hypothetical protein